MYPTGFLLLLLVSGQTHAQEWSACSKPCGAGSKTMQSCKLETCEVHASVGCNTQPCAPDTWDTYTPCSQSCGGGYRFRVPRCEDGDVNVCKKIYEECNTDPCPPTSHCPEGIRFGTLSSCCNTSKEECGVAVESPTSKGRTLTNGGTESKLGQWPWAAAIVVKNTLLPQCGGTLIHKNWVLSAAHCMIDAQGTLYDKKAFYVLLGSTSIKNPESSMQTIGIKRFAPHEDYKFPAHNIGLIKLATSAVINQYVSPICLPRGEEIQLDAKCIAAGWGRLRTEATEYGDMSDILIHERLSNLPEDACVNGLRDVAPYVSKFSTQENLCFGRLAGGIVTCMNDIDGPVMCQRCSSCGWYLTGTTSYGSPGGCDHAGQTKVYMDVQKYESWIRKKVYGFSVYKDATC